MVKLSVIIPHLNQPDDLARCLASLHQQTGIYDLSGIAVVDNGSREMPEAKCAAWDDVHLYQELEPGPGPARNYGVAQADGDVLVFIDADCTAAPGWLAAITNAFDSDPSRGILGGDVRIPRRDGDRTTMIEAYESIYAYRMKEYIAKQGFTGTGNLAVRRAVMMDVGPFGGLNIAEDRDWGRRATGAGYATTYVSDMIIYHPARASFAELVTKWDRQISHDYAEVRTSKDRLKWLAKAVLLAGSPLGEVTRIFGSDRVQGIRERLLALRCLIRIRHHRTRRMLTILFGKDNSDFSQSWNRD